MQKGLERVVKTLETCLNFGITDMFSLLVGAIVGCIVSSIFILLKKHVFYPKVTVSKKISCIMRNGNPIYRIKIKNISHRKIYDLKLYARLEVYGMDEALPDNCNTFYLHLSFDGFHPFLAPQKAAIFHVYNVIDDYDIQFYSNRNQEILSRYNLEELLVLTDKVKLSVSVFSKDYTGIERVHIQNYDANCIFYGTFQH